jgi:hypothetical protein
MISRHNKFQTNFIILVFMMIAAGCSKEENNPLTQADDSDKYFWIYYSNDSAKVAFKNLPKFNADGEEAIQLNYFIDTSLIHPFVDKNGLSHDTRTLYSYQIVGDDGFSASGNRGYPNNIWEHFFLGHVINSNRQVIFPDNKIDLPGAYNIKLARRIFIHRKIDLKFIDSTRFVELKNIPPIQVINPQGLPEQAVPLKNIVIAIVSNPETYNYNLLSVDNFGPTSDMTWNQFQTGYWLLESQATMFTDTTLVGGRYKLKVLEKILVK